MAFETGTCNYIVKWNVYITETGPFDDYEGERELQGEYETYDLAVRAIEAAGFIPHYDDWKKPTGIDRTYGYVESVVEYDFGLKEKIIHD